MTTVLEQEYGKEDLMRVDVNELFQRLDYKMEIE